MTASTRHALTFVALLVAVVAAVCAWVVYSGSAQHVGPSLCRRLLTDVLAKVDGRLADDMTVIQASDGSYSVGGVFLVGDEALPVGCSMTRVNGTWTARVLK